MNGSSYNPFDDVQLDPQDVIDVYKSKQEGDSKEKNPFDELDFDEGFWTNAFRTVSQIPQGIASTTVPGLLGGLAEVMAHGEIFDPEEIEHIKMISEREGIPFDEEAYIEAGKKALGGVPTVSNIASKIEEKTGLPLEPKTRLQKGLRFATEATRLIPENQILESGAKVPIEHGFRGTNIKLPRPVLGAGIEATKEGLQELGLPEPIAEAASLLVLKQMPEGSPGLKVGTEKKPSGMTNRRFENLEEPFRLPEKKINKINDKVENEFRDIASKIIEKSPIEETFSSLKKDTGFKKAAGEAFQEVESLAEEIPGTLSSRDLKKELANKTVHKKDAGITPSEFDKSKKDYIVQLLKDTPKKTDITAKDLVSQYRKNNKSLSEAYEPGLSFSKNRAKREALLEYNKSIASIIEKKFPNTEFSNLFKSSNENWSKIMDAEAVDKFMDKLFDGKIDFKKSKNLIEKNGMKVPFERALGKEGYKNFEQLNNDLLSMEKGHKMLRVAQKEGYYDLFKTGLAYVTIPVAGQVKLAKDIAQGTYKTLYEFMLDKPKLILKWDEGLKAFKKGDFSTAEKTFNSLEKERLQSLEKFNEKKQSSTKK